MTVAEVIYYTGVHPYTLKPINTAKTSEEKKNQNRFFFWYKRENHGWIRERLKKANRPELIEQLLGDTVHEPNHHRKPASETQRPQQSRTGKSKAFGEKKEFTASSSRTTSPGNKPAPKWLEERRKRGK
jgi:hypothetical protein